ncbi:MAG: hypothetical protein Q9169_004403 [Polycauliona sp. 2 TL-2023]
MATQSQLLLLALYHRQKLSSHNQEHMVHMAQSLDASHQGRGHAVVRKQVATKPPSQVQLHQIHVEVQTSHEKHHKTPSHSNDPKPTASAHKENGHGKAARAAAQSQPQQSHVKKAKSSTKGGQGQGHHQKNLNPPTKGGREQNNHHNNSGPSSEIGAREDHSEKTKSPRKKHKLSGHNEDEAAQPDRGSAVPEDDPLEWDTDEDETSLNTEQNGSESHLKSDSDQEPDYDNINEEDDYHHHAEPLNSQSIPAEGQIDPYLFPGTFPP